MERATLLCALLLLYQTQGSSAVTPVFVQTGGDVNLDVSEDQVPKDFDIFLWKFETDELLVKFTPSTKTISKGYTDRIDTFEKKYSVRLKSLKKADSGIYIGRVIAKKDQILAEYNVTVQDPVLPVFLTSSVLNSSSSSCDLTVTCRAADSHISSSFRCDTAACYQNGGGQSEVTKSGASLRIHLSNESVVCNHSNQVSWTKSEKSIRSFCPRVDETRNRYLLVVIIVTVFVILIVVFIVCYKRRRDKKGKTEITGNSVYAVAEINNIQTQNKHQADDTEDSSPATTYSMVKHSTRRDVPPETIYAMIQK